MPHPVVLRKEPDQEASEAAVVVCDQAGVGEVFEKQALGKPRDLATAPPLVPDREYTRMVRLWRRPNTQRAETAPRLGHAGRFRDGDELALEAISRSQASSAPSARR